MLKSAVHANFNVCLFTSGVCPTRNPPINGDVAVSTHNVEGVATFTCDNGYELSGLSRCTCLATGNWSEEVPVCIGTFNFRFHSIEIITMNCA